MQPVTHSGIIVIYKTEVLYGALLEPLGKELDAFREGQRGRRDMVLLHIDPQWESGVWKLEMWFGTRGSTAECESAEADLLDRLKEAISSRTIYLTRTREVDLGALPSLSEVSTGDWIRELGLDDDVFKAVHEAGYFRVLHLLNTPVDTVARSAGLNLEQLSRLYSGVLVNYNDLQPYAPDTG